MTERRAILIHGIASSAQMWIEAGWPELLSEIVVATSAAALPGHSESTLPPDATAAQIVDEIVASDPHADTIIGFSAGAGLALRAAASHPGRFRHVALLGLGDRMWDGPSGFADRLRSGDGPDARILRSISAASGNELENVARFIEANPGPPAWSELSAISASVLVVLGADDGAGPADQLSAALPRCEVIILPGVDHYRTPASPGAMMAVLRFLEIA